MPPLRNAPTGTSLTRCRRSASSSAISSNGFAESFHSRLREECLNQEVFYSAQHAQVILNGYRQFFNVRRPHSSLGYRTPDEFAGQARGRPDAPLCGQDTANVVARPSPGQAERAHGVPFS